MYDFGLRLQHLRKRLGMSQADVAKRLHLHSGTISAYENNVKIPSVGILTDLAALYNTSADYILGLDQTERVSLEGLTDAQKAIVNMLVTEFKRENK